MWSASRGMEVNIMDFSLVTYISSLIGKMAWQKPNQVKCHTDIVHGLKRCVCS